MKNPKPIQPVFKFISERPLLSVNRIAKQTGFSQPTLSLAKDGLRTVSKEIEDKVIEAVKPYGYIEWLNDQKNEELYKKMDMDLLLHGDTGVYIDKSGTPSLVDRDFCPKQ